MKNLGDIRMVILCSPVFNCRPALEENFPFFVDLRRLLAAYECSLRVIMTDDFSSDGTGEFLDKLAQEHNFLCVRHNEENMGNAPNIVAAYKTAFAMARTEHGDDAQQKVLIGSLDGDGEHNPLLMRKHIDYITLGISAKEIRERVEKNVRVKQRWSGYLIGLKDKDRVKFDGVVGSIIYPDHSMDFLDGAMMRFNGMLQSVQVGVPEPFYIQSPGWQLHRIRYLHEAVCNFLPRYKAFFAGRNPNFNFPKWGMHGVIDQLISLAGGRLWSAFLECYGLPPNRDTEKLLKQGEAAMIHNATFNAFQGAVAGGLA